MPDLVIFRRADGGRIDLLIAKTKFERDAIESSVPLGRLRVVQPEHLIAYKLIASRTRDIADIEDVVSAQKLVGRTIDWSIIERALEPWGISDRVEALKTRIGDR